jgi:APA family basic amino acid/polyamine antiporter
MAGSIFRTRKPQDLLKACSDENAGLKKSLNAFDLVTLGIGAIVGAGIFVVTGVAAAGDISQAGVIVHTPAGPGLSLSFLLTAVGCCFCALCYAEFAAMLPVAGSAYTYAYASLGEIFAWIIGWDLLLEYTFDGSAVAVGWAGYFRQFFERVFHVAIPEFLTTPWTSSLMDTTRYHHFPHVFQIPLSLNLPAMLVILCVSALLIRGIRESARVNHVVVGMKLVVITVFIAAAAGHIDKSNWTPFLPYGFKGVLSGASLIFFAYIGFDALTTASEEVKNPARNIPVGIIGSLLICTILYIIVTLILTGIAPYRILNTPDPIATGLNYIGKSWLATYVVCTGAIVALLSTMIVMLMGQPRILFSMSRDGFLPPLFSRVHPRYKTPVNATIITGSLLMLLAGICDISKLAELGNIGTLFAFIMVSAGVLVLRKKLPDHPRPFKVPFVPIVPVLGILMCLTLMCYLPAIAWAGFFIWLVIGLVVYFGYSRRHIIAEDDRPASGEES